MYFLILGLALMVLKFLNVAPVADWSWWWVLAPFALAAAWWWLADATGYTRRRAMAREEALKTERANERRKQIGLPPKR